MRGEAKDNPMPVAVCVCDNCENEFMVPNHDDFKPNYCCFCGWAFFDEDEDAEEWEPEEW